MTSDLLKDKAPAEEERIFFMKAAACGDLEKLRAFLLKHPDFIDVQDQQGWTALLHAAWNGQKETVALLLDAGADINHQAKTGKTALMWAARNFGAEIVELLLSRGADAAVISPDNRKTALDFARSSKDDRTIEVLISHLSDCRKGLKGNVAVRRPLNLRNGAP